MAISNTQTYAVQFEKVSKKVPQLYSLSQLMRKRIKQVPIEKVSTWNAASGGVLGYRMPIKQYAGGDFSSLNLDNGTFPTGSMPTYQYMTIGYATATLAFLLPSLTLMATGSPDQASVNVFKDTMSNAFESFGAYEDDLFFGSGDGIFATGIGTGAAPATTDPIYTLEPNFGPQRLELGSLVDIYSADGSVLRGSNLNVTAIDPVAKNATLKGSVTGPTNADNIVMAGLAVTLAAGSTRYGLYNYQNSATSGSTLGLSRTTVPELVTPNFTANASVTPQMALILSDYLIQRRNEKALANIEGISHMAQRQAAFTTGDVISEWQIPGPTIAENLDRVPQNKKESSKFTFGGVVHTVSKRANRSRLDWWSPDNYQRVNLQEPDFWKTPDGKYVFENRASTGAVKTALFFAIVSTENIGTGDPGCGGILSALSIPAGM